MAAEDDPEVDVQGDEAAAARSNAAAYYVWPLVWIGSVPDNVHVSVGQGEMPPPLVLDQLEEAIVTVELSHGIRARAHRDGLLVFDFSEWAPYRDASPAERRFEDLAKLVLRRVALMNAHVACLLTALLRDQNLGLRATALSPASIFPMHPYEQPQTVGLPDPRLGHVYGARYPSTYGAHAPMVLDWRISGRLLIETATIESSFVQLESMLNGEDPDRTIALADLLVRAVAAYSDHDYSQALITAWTVIESLLQEQWGTYVQANRERTVDGERVSFINAGRKKRLTEDRDITASLVSELLSILDRLPIATYHKVSEVRVARNKWIHDLVPAAASTAQLAIESAADMLRLLGHADLAFSTGLSIQI
jgi:hypothetical protein